MKRKTSTLPTRVYKYAARPPTVNAELVDESFCEARRYFNKLVTIENRRRFLYRQARVEIFADYAAAESAASALEGRLQDLRQEISAAKADARSRKVEPSAGAAVKAARAELKAARQKIASLGAEIRLAEHEALVKELEAKLAAYRVDKKEKKAEKTVAKIAKLRDEVTEMSSKTSCPQAVREKVSLLRKRSEVFDAEANAAVKSLRPTLYWGTYLLVEKAANQAASRSKVDVAYNETPPHLLSSRIGVHWNHGTTVADVLDQDTLMQIVDPPDFRQTGKNKIWRSRPKRTDDGEIVRCVLRFRVGSVGKSKDPLWAEFPLLYDRPLPAEGLIKDAYVTRRPLRERNPWQYHLCVVVESPSFERTLPSLHQEGVTTVNFGWRQLPGGGLRVATVNRDGQVPRFVELPAKFVSGFGKCESLQGLVDMKFEDVKKEIASFIKSREGRQFSESDRLPEIFVKAFDHVSLWKSPHRLCELVRYWGSHRVPGDAGIFSVADEWRVGYLHLHDWSVNQRRHLLRWREDLYGRVAKQLVTTSAKIVVDTFCIADVARKRPAEEAEEGGDASRRNRVLASPGELRETIMRAARKYHCEVVAAPTVDGTRRCNVCGKVYDWDPAKSVDHTCEGDDCGATWDQDVNNTDNLHDACASGYVVPLVRPAEVTRSGDFQQSDQLPYRAAREMLGK